MSLPRSLMPLTPAVSRPMERTSLSWKRIAFPFLVVSTTSLSPLVSVAVSRVSPSLIRTARNPPALTFRYWEKSVRLTRPRRVAVNRWSDSGASSSSGSGTMATTWRSFGRLRRLTMARPVPALPASGIS